MPEEEEQATPSRLMTRDMGILVDRVFTYGVSKYAQTRNPDDVDIETYRLMQGDSQISAGLNCMILATIGNGWEFNFKDLNDTDQVDFIRRAYSGINQMPGKRGSLFEVFREVLSALWAGYSVTEKVWKQDQNGKWVISRYKVLPPETIEFKVDKQGRLSKSSAVIQNPNARNPVVLPARKVNVFTINGDFGNPYGTSILKPVHKTWYVKDWLLKFHSMFLENMGSPFWVGKTNRDTADMNAALQDAKQSAVITLGEGEDVSIIETQNSGAAFLDAIRYHDGQIMRGMLVPSLLTGQDETYGSRALSEVQFEMFKLSRIGALQTQLQSWINHDIREMIQLNFGKQESYPELQFRSWSRADMTKMSRMIGDLITARVVTPDEAWIRQFLELPERDPKLDPISPEEPVPTSDKTPLPGDRKTEVAARAPGEDAVVSKNEQVRVDVFSTKEEAVARAEELGCEGTHTMDENGQTLWMPCSTHDEYDTIDEDLKKKRKDEYEHAFAEVIGMRMSRERTPPSNITYQKDLPSDTEGTRKVNILDFSSSMFASSKPSAYDDRADSDLLCILKRGGKALTPTEVNLLNARELALEKGQDKFRWLGEINGTN